MVWRLQEGHNSVPKYILCSVVNTLFAIHLVQRVLYIQAYKHHIFLPHTDCKSISKLSYCWMEAKCIPSFISLPLSSIGDSAAHLISLRAKHTAAAAAKSLQLCPTLCDPIDGSPLGYSVPGILQARILEWVAISFSNAWKWKVKVKSHSCAWLLATPWTAAYQAPPSMGFSRQEYWSGLPRLWFFLLSCMDVRVGLWRRLSAEELMLLNVVLEKTLESPLDYKEIQPVHSEGDQP